MLVNDLGADRGMDGDGDLLSERGQQDRRVGAG
jgi:hypothetical protein